MRSVILLIWLAIAAAFAVKAGAWLVAVCAAIVALGELLALVFKRPTRRIAS